MLKLVIRQQILYFSDIKHNIAMTEERIITAAVITSGEKHDGKQLQELVAKSEQSGIEVRDIIGDAAIQKKTTLPMQKKTI